MNKFFDDFLLYRTMDSPDDRGREKSKITPSDVKKFFKGFREKLAKKVEDHEAYKAEVDKLIDEMDFGIDKAVIPNVIGLAHEKTLFNRVYFGLDVPKVNDVIGSIYEWGSTDEEGKNSSNWLLAGEKDTQYTLVEMSLAAFAEGGMETAKDFTSKLSAISKKDRDPLTDDGFRYEHIVTELAPRVIEKDSIYRNFRPIINEVLGVQEKYLKDLDNRFKYMMNGYVYGCFMMAGRKESEGGLPLDLQPEYKDFVMRQYDRVVYAYSDILNLWDFDKYRNEIIEHLHKLVLPPSKWLEVRGKARENLSLDS